MSLSNGENMELSWKFFGVEQFVLETFQFHTEILRVLIWLSFPTNHAILLGQNH